MKRILFCGAKSVIEPLGLLHLAGLARDMGWERQFFLLEKEKEEEFLKEIKDFKPDLVGFNIYTGNHRQTFNLINRIKLYNPNIGIIVGGPHPTYFPVESSEIADFVVMSEGFLSLKKILSGTAKKGILPMSETMNFPLPDRKTLYSRYPEYGSSNIKSVISMTGCPYRCTYCYNSSTPSDINLTPELAAQMSKTIGMGGRLFPFNIRSVSDVIKEVEEIKNNWDTKVVYFQDDVHGFDIKEWMPEFAKEWKEKIKIPYHAQMRWEMTKGESGNKRLDLLRSAGCFGLTLAIEAADPIVRDEVLDRKMDDSLVFEWMAAVINKGFRVRTEQISGLPYGATTRKTPMNLEADIGLIKLSVDLQKIANGPTMSWVSTLAPYIGTKLGAYCNKYGHYSNVKNNDVPDTFFERSVLRFPKEWIGPDLEKLKNDNSVWLSNEELEKYRDQNAALRKYFHVFCLVPDGDQLARRYLHELDFSIPKLCISIKEHLADKQDHRSITIKNNIEILNRKNTKFSEYFGCIPYSDLAHNRYISYLKDKEDNATILSTATRHHLYDEVLYKV